jgi:hypothetical protein
LRFVTYTALHRLYHYSPDDFRQVSFKYSGRRGGAVSSLPVKARREDTLAQSDFGEWIVKHIDHWFAYARQLGLGIEQMEDIILVTGCDRVRSWSNVSFLGNQVDAEARFGVKVSEGHGAGINVQFSPGHVVGAVLNHGSEGTVRLCPVRRLTELIDLRQLLPWFLPLAPTRGSMRIHPRVSCCPYPQDISKAS